MGICNNDHDDLEHMRDALHENIMNELLEDMNENESDHRYVYEIVTFDDDLVNIMSLRYYTNAVDCQIYMDQPTVSILYKRVGKSSPQYAMAFHNSNVHRIQEENGIVLNYETRSVDSWP